MFEISDEEFRLLSDFINNKSGIYYHERQKYIFQQKVSKRLEKNGLKTFKEYYYLLKYSNSSLEIQELYNVLTVNETYFFRENNHLEVLVKDIYPEMFKKRPNRIIKILSAGCSTGEEPYSISMVSHDNLNTNINNISILGIDINKKALEQAKTANYRKISLTFRAIPKSELEKYFNTLDESYQLKENVKSIVNFKAVNLMDYVNSSSIDKFDIIFCRNVMIYFNKKFKEQLVNYFYNILNTDGYLILSNTENLNDINSEFKITKKNSTFLYQK